jgi:hypothetical protein
MKFCSNVMMLDDLGLMKKIRFSWPYYIIFPPLQTACLSCFLESYTTETLRLISVDMRPSYYPLALRTSPRTLHVVSTPRDVQATHVINVPYHHLPDPPRVTSGLLVPSTWSYEIPYPRDASYMQVFCPKHFFCNDISLVRLNSSPVFDQRLGK